MKKVLFLAFFLGIASLSAGLVMAQTAPVAVIQGPAAGVNYTVGQVVPFGGNASGGDSPYNFDWNFGDGTTAAGQSYDKTYATAGTFTVTLLVHDFSGNSASVSRDITINAVPPSVPTVDLLINGGQGPITVATGTIATLTWTSANTTTCTASGAWTGSKATSGTESTGALNTVGAFTYTLFCAGASTVSDSVTINVQVGTTGITPVISNILVDGVTQNSAVIHWNTNIPADSRVIYDTVSHPILGAAPNFGYAFTTTTSDTSPKVTTHTITVSGLTPNTQYFFRVLSQS